MKKLAETALVVLVTFIVTLSIQTLVNYLTSPNLEIIIGPKMFINSEIYQSVDLTNTSNKSINDIKLSIPQNVIIDSIISSNPITIRVISNNNNKLSKSVEISNIRATEITKLLIPLNNINQTIEVISYKDIKLSSYHNI